MKMTIAEFFIIFIIVLIVGIGITLIPELINCATMQVSEMPGYCFYLLQK